MPWTVPRKFRWRADLHPLFVLGILLVSWGCWLLGIVLPIVELQPFPFLDAMDPKLANPNRTAYGSLTETLEKSTVQTLRLLRGSEYYLAFGILLFCSLVIPFVKNCAISLALLHVHGQWLAVTVQYLTAISSYQLVDLFVGLLFVAFCNTECIEARLREGFPFFAVYCVVSQATLLALKSGRCGVRLRLAPGYTGHQAAGPQQPVQVAGAQPETIPVASTEAFAVGDPASPSSLEAGVADGAGVALLVDGGGEASPGKLSAARSSPLSVDGRAAVSNGAALAFFVWAVHYQPILDTAITVNDICLCRRRLTLDNTAATAAAFTWCGSSLVPLVSASVVAIPLAAALLGSLGALARRCRGGGQAVTGRSFGGNAGDGILRLASALLPWIWTDVFALSLVTFLFTVQGDHLRTVVPDGRVLGVDSEWFSGFYAGLGMGAAGFSLKWKMIHASGYVDEAPYEAIPTSEADAVAAPAAPSATPQPEVGEPPLAAASPRAVGANMVDSPTDIVASAAVEPCPSTEQGASTGVDVCPSGELGAESAELSAPSDAARSPQGHGCEIELGATAADLEVSDVAGASVGEAHSDGEGFLGDDVCNNADGSAVDSAASKGAHDGGSSTQLQISIAAVDDATIDDASAEVIPVPRAISSASAPTGAGGCSPGPSPAARSASFVATPASAPGALESGPYGSDALNASSVETAQDAALGSAAGTLEPTASTAELEEEAQQAGSRHPVGMPAGGADIWNGGQHSEEHPTDGDSGNRRHNTFTRMGKIMSNPVFRLKAVTWGIWAACYFLVTSPAPLSYMRVARALEGIAPLINGAIAKSLPHSIGECTAQAPEPCVGNEPLYTGRPVDWSGAQISVLARWASGINTVRLDGFSVRVNHDSVKPIEVEFRGEIESLKMSIRVQRCISWGCSSLWDNAEGCCEPHRRFELVIATDCVEGPDGVGKLGDFKVEWFDIDKIALSEQIIGIPQEVADLTPKVREKVKKAISDLFAGKALVLNMTFAEVVSRLWRYNTAGGTKCSDLLDI